MSGGPPTPKYVPSSAIREGQTPLSLSGYIALEKELIRVRNRLDREVQAHQRMQRFNVRALAEGSMASFAQLVAEAVVDIFEVEVGVCVIVGSEPEAEPLVAAEGLRLGPESRRGLAERLAQLAERAPAGAVAGCMPAPGDFLRDVAGLAQVAVVRLQGDELFQSFLILGGISVANAPLYEPLDRDREAGIGVFFHQAHAHLRNSAKSRMLKDTLAKLETDRGRIAALAQCFLGFDQDPEHNIRRILQLPTALGVAERVVYARSEDGTHYISEPAMTWGGKGVACGLAGLPELPRDPAAPCLWLARAPAELTAGKSATSGASSLIATRIFTEGRELGTLLLLLPVSAHCPPGLPEFLRLLAGAIAVEERRRLSAVALAESERKYRLIFEGTPSGVVIVDCATRCVQFANSAACRMSGYQHAEIVGRPTHSFRPAEFTPSSDSIWREIEEKDVLVLAAVPFRRADGGVFHVDLSIHTIELVGKKMLAGFMTDVSEQMEDRRKLEDSNAALRKINAEMDGFIYSLSHDLRAPLLALRGLVGLVRQAGSNAEVAAKFLEMMEKSVKRMDDTIMEIIDYSRNSRLETRFEPIDIERLIREAFEDVKHLSNLPIALEINVHQLVPFLSDSYRISTLFKNIVGNAVKYSRASAVTPRIRVAGVVDPGGTVLRFEDNGIGIAPEHIGRVFDMFYRASSASVGSGLGLFLCKEIVEKLGGRISLDSELGVGSVFKVALPAARPV